MPQQYSSISGHLTLTSPRPGDLRLDPTLNVMPAGSLNNLPAVDRGYGRSQRERTSSS